MCGYNSIQNQNDIMRFDLETNGLHDGYLLSVQYQNQGITPISGGHCFDPAQTSLRLWILVTSIRDAIAELVFTGIQEWQIRDTQQDITDCAISLEPDGSVIWADAQTTDPLLRREGSYVIAQQMYWRIVQ